MSSDHSLRFRQTKPASDDCSINQGCTAAFKAVKCPARIGEHLQGADPASEALAQRCFVRMSFLSNILGRRSVFSSLHADVLLPVSPDAAEPRNRLVTPMLHIPTSLTCDLALQQAWILIQDVLCRRRRRSHLVRCLHVSSATYRSADRAQPGLAAHHMSWVCSNLIDTCAM